MSNQESLAAWWSNPQNHPPHRRLMFVRLSCGHSRFTVLWRGEVGESYCCDVCHVMTTITEVRERVTGEPSLPTRWWPTYALTGPHTGGSAAMGIPQFAKLPAASATSAAEQIKAGMEYIQQRYARRQWDAFQSGWWPSERWHGRRRLVLRVGRLRVRVVWRRDG